MPRSKPAMDEILWSRTAPPPPESERPDGDAEADVLIVGAGLTGLRAAVTLAEAGTKVIVADAKTIGHGASGRSGGQCNPIWRQTPDELRTMFGAEQGERLISATLTAADDLFDDIRRLKIDCGAEQNGWLQTAHTRKAAKGLTRLGDAWRAVGGEIEPLDGDEAHRASGSKEYGFALRHAKGGFVHPLALTRGFASAAKEAGARLFSDCPAKSMERKDGKWHVDVPGGVIRAENVILATNAYTDTLWPGLKQTVLPMVSIALATRPLTREEQAAVLPGRVTLSDTRLAIYFCRYDADNRLIFGCIGSGDSAAMLGGYGRLRAGLRRVFPQIADIEVECSWAGRIAVTPELMPHLHEPAPGVLAGLGYSGRGIAMTSVMGRALARKLLTGENQGLPFPISPLKPGRWNSPLRHLIPFAAPAMATLDRAAVFRDRNFG